MSHPLAGFSEAKDMRGRCLAYITIKGVRHYYVGFSEHSTDRDAAIRYASDSKMLEHLVLNGHIKELA